MSNCVRIVVLAAGRSRRIGVPKLLLPFRGRPLIDYAIAAALPWDPIVVAGPEVAAYLAGRAGVTILRNDESARGMAYSLRLASAQVNADLAIAVLLGDKPLVTEALIRNICYSRRADVVYPVCNHEPVHPVYLSPRARACLDRLPVGDSVRLLRVDRRLSVRAIVTRDRGATFDVDTIDQFV